MSTPEIETETVPTVETVPTTETVPTAEAVPTAETPVTLARAPRRPRIRTGAVLWGLVLAGLAGWTLWLAADPGRRTDAIDAVTALDGFGWTVVVLIAVGALLTLIALAAVIRRVQTRAR